MGAPAPLLLLLLLFVSTTSPEYFLAGTIMAEAALEELAMVAAIVHR